MLRNREYKLEGKFRRAEQRQIQLNLNIGREKEFSERKAQNFFAVYF